MELRRLAAFVAVVDEGGFTDAADLLGVSQPAVSQAIRSLEDELGAPLFHRVGRGVRLTDAGRALLDPARLTLRDAAVARAAVDDVRGLRAGHLELACLPTLAASPMAPLLGALRRRHPAVTVELLDPDDTEDAVALVRAGRCELAIVGAADVGPLIAVGLEPQEFLAILPPGTHAPATLDAAELAAHPLVAPPAGTSSRLVLDELLARQPARSRVVVQTAQREALVPLVLAGAGAALVPAPLAAIAGRLGCGVASIAPTVRREVLLVHRDAPLSPAAGAFVALASPRDGQVEVGNVPRP